MNFKEVEFSYELWNKLYSIAVYQGGSLHCDEWLAEYEGKTYRIFWCAGDIKSIEEKV